MDRIMAAKVKTVPVNEKDISINGKSIRVKEKDIMVKEIVFSKRKNILQVNGKEFCAYDRDF